jgi:hypothetical protein
MPIDGGAGVSLGQASGKIVIDLSDLNNVRIASQKVGQDVERNLGRIGTGAAKAQSGFTALSGTAKQLAATFGITFGAASIVALGRFAVGASQLATSFERQSVAAVSLAGSQSKLNDLLTAYDKVTGGVINRVTALSDVTKLQALGFADTTAELSRFVRAARGISVALGSQQDYVISQLQLAIANQSTMRLDQLGLGVAEVKNRIDELQAADKNLTKEMAYQNAILGLAEEKFGALTDSAVAQATGMEKLAKSWSSLRLEVGFASGGLLNQLAKGAALFLDVQTARLRAWVAELDVYIRLLRQIGVTSPGMTSSERRFVGSMSSIDRGRHGRSSGSTGIAGPRWGEDQAAVETILRDRYSGLANIEREASSARLEATRQYEDQRTSTIREYGKTLVRDAEDFTRQRLRAEKAFTDSITDLRDAAARRDAAQAEDLARAINESLTDADEKIAEAREDANKRLADIDEDYHKARERAERDHRDNLFSAASRLDAVAVFEEQKRFARESQDAKEAHEEQKDDLEKALAERIRDEQEALEKSNRQRRESFARQQDQQHEEDARRIVEMTEDFEEQRRLADEDRAINLARMAIDHADQLAEMDRQHALDLAQISEHERESRAQLEEDFQIALNELGIRTDKWIAQNRRITLAAIEDFDLWFNAIQNAFNMPVQGPPTAPGAPSFPSLFPQARPQVALPNGAPILNPFSGGSSRSGFSGPMFEGNVALTILGGTNMGPAQILSLAKQAFEEVLRELAN